MKKKYWDLASGIFFFLFSVALFIGAQNVKTLAISSIGSGFFPSIVAVVLGIVSLVIVAGGIKKAKGQDEAASGKEGKPRVLAVVGTFALMAVYAALLPIVGFLITTTLYLFLQINILSENQHRRPLLFGLISIVTSVAVYYLFVMVFKLMLPAGILG